MRRSDLFHYKKVIPLWWPSPAIKIPEICVGDVGSFDDEGVFEVLFNIFLSANDNAAHGFSPPDDFEPYPAGVSGEISRVIPISKHDYRPCSGDFTEDIVPSSGRFVKSESMVTVYY